jgi:drug/metabolite transporter (DMT)-like permease
LGGASYGCLSTLVKLAYDEGYSTSDVTGSYTLFGFLLLLVICLLQYKSMQKFQGLDILKLMFAGTFIGITGIFYYLSLRYIPASLAIVFLFQFVWIGLLIERVVDKKKLTPAKWVALIIVWIGTMLAINIFAADWKLLTPIGVIFGFLSGLTYAIYIYLSGKIALTYNAIQRSTTMLFGALVITFIIFPPEFLVSGDLETGLLKWAILIAILGGVIPTLAFNYGVPKIGVGLSSIFGASELPVAVFLSMLILNETIFPIQWLGNFLILFAIIIADKWGQ